MPRHRDYNDPGYVVEQQIDLVFVSAVPAVVILGSWFPIARVRLSDWRAISRFT